MGYACEQRAPAARAVELNRGLCATTGIHLLMTSAQMHNVSRRSCRPCRRSALSTPACCSPASGSALGTAHLSDETPSPAKSNRESQRFCRQAKRGAETYQVCARRGVRDLAGIPAVGAVVVARRRVWVNAAALLRVQRRRIHWQTCRRKPPWPDGLVRS